MTNCIPIIYQRNTNGSIQQWEIIVSGNTYYTREGLVDGKLTETKITKVYGKNENKINKTTDEEQAYLEAKRKWSKKIESGYHENINDIDNENNFFEPMLAKSYLDRKDKIEFPVLVSTKLDGHRLVATKDGLFTRNGKEYVSCPHIIEMLKPVFEKHPNWVIDGEIYSREVPFEKICSLVRKTKPTPEDLKESEKVVQYWVFDGIIDDRQLGFEERFTIIREELMQIIKSQYHLRLVQNFIVNSHEEIEKEHDGFVRRGFEGLMIRIPNSIYENKRSSNLLKFKKFTDAEFKIIDIVEGVGNRSDMAGNIVLEMKDKKTFSANIKGGEDYYKEIWVNKEKIINKYATVRFQNLSEAGIPRFPIAVNIDRWDI